MTEETPLVHQDPAEVVRIARAVCPASPVICEIGSRDALDGIYLSKALDAAECHVFEPNPASIQTCLANLARYGRGRNICFNPLALSNVAGPVDFFPVNAGKSANMDLGFSSMFRVNPACASKRRGNIIQDRITLDATTRDCYFHGRQRGPDLLWIDVEGAEKLVLAGGKTVLKGVTLIHIEVSFRPMQVGKPLWWEIDGYLRGQGFRLFKFVGVSRLKAFMVVHKLLPNLPWRWNALNLRGGTLMS